MELGLANRASRRQFDVDVFNGEAHVVFTSDATESLPQLYLTSFPLDGSPPDDPPSRRLSTLDYSWVGGPVVASGPDGIAVIAEAVIEGSERALFLYLEP